MNTAPCESRSLPYSSRAVIVNVAPTPAVESEMPGPDAVDDATDASAGPACSACVGPTSVTNRRAEGTTSADEAPTHSRRQP